MKKYILYALGIIVVILVFLFIFGGGADKETLRSTNKGEVIGKIEGDNFVWRGIPFAKPPVGELRWRAPIEPDNWEGTLEALESSEACFQPDGMSMLGQGGGWRSSHLQSCCCGGGRGAAVSTGGLLIAARGAAHSVKQNIRL